MYRIKEEKIKELKFDILNKKQKSLYENMDTLANKLLEIENIGGIKKWKQIIIIH